jgi:hypothetical protein
MPHDDQQPPAPPRRRWWQFNIRTLLVIIAFAALPLGVWATRAREQRWQRLQTAEKQLAEAEKRLEALERRVEYLGEHLQARYWSHPLTEDQLKQYASAELIYRLDGEERRILSLSLDPKSGTTARLSVVLQKFSDQPARATMLLAHENGRVSTRVSFKNTFKYIGGTYDYGDREDPWKETSMLMSGGENSWNSSVGSPANREEVFLRLVKRKKGEK